MTKSKPKPVKPVTCWTLCDAEGLIYFSYLTTGKTAWLEELAGMDWNPPRRIIRVEIRPAPKRRKVAGVKS